MELNSVHIQMTVRREANAAGVHGARFVVSRVPCVGESILHNGIRYRVVGVEHEAASPVYGESLSDDRLVAEVAVEEIA